MYGINIVLTPDRAEGINMRLLAAQCEIGGCVIYVSNTLIRWEPETGENTALEVVIEALDTLVQLEVVDPTLDVCVLADDGVPRPAAWGDGFHHGFRNGLEFRNASVSALRTALNDTEAALSEALGRIAELEIVLAAHDLPKADKAVDPWEGSDSYHV